MKLDITPKVNHINVNEIFGPTVQGEGIHTGQLVAFLRLAGCNLACSWCDTPYSWDWERYDYDAEVHKMTLEEIATQIEPMRVSRIIVSGGEPMLQQRNFAGIREVTGCLLDIETNGTVIPKLETIDAVDMFVVSPKLSHSGDTEQARVNPDALIAFAELSKQGKAMFKFVAETPSDFNEIEAMIDIANIPAAAVWVMPLGATADDQLASMRLLADPVISKGWNLSPRIHTLIWNLERGR